MARNLPPPASRYAGLTSGPRESYTYETQVGVPVDGTNELLRVYSPFTLSLVSPDPLGTSSTGATDVLSFAAAATSTGSNNASGAARGLVTAGTATSYTAASLREAASAPRPAGLGLPPRSVMADDYTAIDIRLQRETLARVEPLTLLVNPTDMSRSFDRIHSFQNRNRYGYIYQVWGEQLAKVTFSGSTAGFVAGSTRGYQALVDRDTGTPSGYQWASRRDSAAWQNFEALVQFYRNNGYVYDTLGRSEAHLMVGAVRIVYDDIMYEGHIDSLNFGFDENTPLRVQFDVEFTATRIVDQTRASGAVAPMVSPTGGSNIPGLVSDPGDAAAAVATAGLAVVGAAAGRSARRLETATPPLED